MSTYLGAQPEDAGDKGCNPFQRPQINRYGRRLSCQSKRCERYATYRDNRRCSP